MDSFEASRHFVGPAEWDDDPEPVTDGDAPSPHAGIDEAALRPDEILIQPNGQPRHAGADHADTAWIGDMRRLFESSLYAFAKGVLGLTRLTPSLHRPVCEQLQRVPPYRKLLLLPRDHLKTSIASRALPLHILLQPRDANVYMPGRLGADLRILLAGEKDGNAAKQLGWIKARLESTTKLRGFWPALCWDKPAQQSRRWSNSGIIVPREQDYPEASIEPIGVGGAITGAHFDVMIKDDLISVEAANSAVVMQKAIDWHDWSRALMDHVDTSLEFTIGTRWAIHDLYDHILKDPTVEPYVRAVLEEGMPIFPEMFSLAAIQQLQGEFGVMFPLLYMNAASDPSLTDFDCSLLRHYEWQGQTLVVAGDARDATITAQHTQRRGLPPTRDLRGVTLTPEVMRELLGYAPPTPNGRPVDPEWDDPTGSAAYLRDAGRSRRPWLRSVSS